MPEGRQTINGKEYIFKYQTVWNKEKKRPEQKRKYIGKIVDGEFVPNKEALLQKLKEEQPKETERLLERETTRNLLLSSISTEELQDELGKRVELFKRYQPLFATLEDGIELPIEKYSETEIISDKECTYYDFSCKSIIFKYDKDVRAEVKLLTFSEEEGTKRPHSFYRHILKAVADWHRDRYKI